MNAHFTTDPACKHFRAPTSKREERLYDRMRGVSCQPCSTSREIKEQLMMTYQRPGHEHRLAATAATVGMLTVVLAVVWQVLA